MKQYSAAAVERTMKVQEVILRAMNKRLTWIEAAEILGITDRTMRRMRDRWEEDGYDGLFDRRTQTPSPKRAPVADVEKVLELYREQYADFNVRHFHEKLQEQHGLDYSYAWVKKTLQTAGLVARRRSRGKHRRRRARRSLPGMLLHIDGSRHQWFQDDRWYDFLVILDDATSEIYYAQFVEAESTRSVMAAVREVVERKGCFCSLYSDRASHFFSTPKAGQPVDTRQPTQVGRALKELGIEPIPAYSPQARGRSERNFGTWQGRLPQELRIHKINTVESANHFLRAEYIAEFNRKFSVEPAECGTAFVPLHRQDLDRVFSIHHERVVARDNTVQFGNLILQLPQAQFRATLAGCRVQVYEHLDDTISIGYGPHTVGRFTAAGKATPSANQQKLAHAGDRPARRSSPKSHSGATFSLTTVRIIAEKAKTGKTR
jgi:transposase